MSRIARVAPRAAPATSAGAFPRRVAVAVARAGARAGPARLLPRDRHRGASPRFASSRAPRSPRARGSLVASAGDGDTGSLLDELDADQRCPVPKDQRPASQLAELQDSLLLGWGAVELPGYVARLGALGAFFYFTLAYPIASYSYDPSTQPVEAVVCALTGSFVAVAVFALLIYNNWSYVRDRLLSATVEYEETGWYDGQTYVKDPEMLARDRLLGTYVVRPIVERLRKTLLACGLGVFVSLAALNAIDAPEYGVSNGGGAFYENGGAGFYKESSAVTYEPPATPEELALEEAEEAEELARYEAAMDRYARDNAAARAQLAEDAASSVE
jgi:hypothetical protein